jgi:WD40 repeat protein
MSGGDLVLVALSWDGVLAGNTEAERAENMLRVWDPTSQTVLATASGLGTTSAMAVAERADVIAVANMDGTIGVCALPTFERRWTATVAGVEALAITRDGGRVAVGDDKGKLRLFAAGKERWQRTLFAGFLSDVAFSPSGRYVAAGGEGSDVVVLEAASGHEVARLPHAKPTADKYGGIYALAFAPDEKTLATLGVDDVVRAYDVPSWRRRFERKSEGQALTLAWTPDGSAFAFAGNYDGPDIKFVTRADGAMTRRPGGHELAITALAFAPDGRLASGSRDKSIFAFWP